MVYRHITHRDTHTHIYIHPLYIQCLHLNLYLYSVSILFSGIPVSLVYGAPRLTCHRWFAAEEVMASARKAEETFVQQLRAEVLCRLCCMGGGCLVEGIGCSLHLWDRLSKILW